MRKILLTERERDVIRLILELLGAGVVLSMALLAPGAVGIFAKKTLQLQRIPRSVRSRALYDMRRQGLISTSRGRDNAWLVLTKKGRLRLKKYKLEELVVAKPRIWDGYWRIVFFDVPNKPPSLNRARDVFRGMLKRLGLARIQKSVWVHPFPCEDEVTYVAEVFRLQPYVRIALAKNISGEELLRRKFNL